MGATTYLWALSHDQLLGVAPAVLGGGTPLLPRHVSGLTLTSVSRDERFVFLNYNVTGTGT